MLWQDLHGPLKINLSQAFAGQRVGVKQVDEKIWLVSFMRYDLGFFDHETCRIESAESPFAAKVLPMTRMVSWDMIFSSTYLALIGLGPDWTVPALPRWPLIEPQPFDQRSG